MEGRRKRERRGERKKGKGRKEELTFLFTRGATNGLSMFLFCFNPIVSSSPLSKGKKAHTNTCN